VFFFCFAKARSSADIIKEPGRGWKKGRGKKVTMEKERKNNLDTFYRSLNIAEH
jgi:hypothetical protein